MKHRLLLRMKKNLSQDYRKTILYEVDYRYRVISVNGHFMIEKRMSGVWLFAHWMRLPVIFKTYQRAKNKVIIIEINEKYHQVSRLFKE